MERRLLLDCKQDMVVLQKVAKETLERLNEQNVTGKKMVVTLTGNITDIQDTYARHRTVTISFSSSEIYPFLHLAATDIESGYEMIFTQYGAVTVNAFDTPEISISIAQPREYLAL